LARRRGNIFGKVGVIAIIIMVGMCIMGAAYGAWTSTVNIPATVNTGDWGIQVTTSDVNASGSGDTLTITLNGVPEGSYTTDFSVANTGSIPIKIQNITGEVSPVGEIVVDSIVGVYQGLQLEAVGSPGWEQAGMVNYTVTPVDTTVTGSIVITFEVIQWNQYVP